MEIDQTKTFSATIFYLNGINRYIDESDIDILEKVYLENKISKNEYDIIKSEMIVANRNRTITEIIK